MSLDFISLTETYFRVWNSRVGADVAKLFEPTGTLRDWDISVSGSKEVGDACDGIYKAVPNIKIDILKIHVAKETSSVAAEILVKLNDEAGTELKVTDVIEYSPSGKIVALRAYKG